MGFALFNILGFLLVAGCASGAKPATKESKLAEPGDSKPGVTDARLPEPVPPDTALPTGASEILAQEGREAMYGERPMVARVRVHEIRVDSWGVKAIVTVIPTPGCIAPQNEWEISAAWEVFSHSKEHWSASYVSWTVYFRDELLRDVISLSKDASLDDTSRKERIRDRFYEPWLPK